jgi:cell wall-associated NlpC family hydrolase
MTTVVGYTSGRIFIQIQRNGVYVNPVLFLGSQRQDLVYGTTLPPLTQSEFNDLTDFASDALGTPYVFGSSNPPTATDCSGFIWWAYDGSGVKSWDRTTAQGQFNQCDPITLADARPGDLIFFQGTYDTKDSRIVTHVGIYLGNGEMQHSGTPNQISSINTSYWQEKFYSFGRLRR